MLPTSPNMPLPVDAEARVRVANSTLQPVSASVFTDFHMFDLLLGPGGAAADPELLELWKTRLGLAGKLQVENGRISDIRLSQGQRKRLALLVALVLYRQQLEALEQQVSQGDWLGLRQELDRSQELRPQFL